MVERFAVGSILTVDWGSLWTKAFLIDRADGNYRFVAKGWAPTFEHDPLRSLQEAISRIEKATGRRLTGTEGMPLIPERELDGVDFFTASVSFPPPLKVMLMGLSEISLEAARRAVKCYYTKETGSFSYLTEESRNARIERLLRTFNENLPDLILIAGGAERSNPAPLVEMAQMLSLVYPLFPVPWKPPVIFAGNSAAYGPVEELLSGLTQLRLVENLMPSLEEQNIGTLFRELEELYRQLRISEIYNLGYLRSTLSAPLIPSLSSFTLIVRYLSSLYGFEGGVLGVDAGGTYITIIGAKKDNFLTVVQSDLSPCRAYFLLKDLERVTRWLPIEVDHEKVAEAILEKALRPETISLTKEELLLEGAILRETLMEAFLTAQEPLKAFFGPELSVDMIVLTGGALSSFPIVGWLTLAVIDAFQLSGITMLAVDRLGLCTPLGSLVYINPQAVFEILERDALTPVGTVIAPSGSAPEGTVAIKAGIHFDDGRYLEAEVKGGNIEVIPLAPGRKASLKINLSRGLNLGPIPKELEVRGGIVGIILDARGRPLTLPARREKIQKWLLGMET
ncbi:MAG: glutamate mutase L [Anaerolineae bacterium]|nr:glutamate mutase L [Anaerolineae bacterium]MDW8102980.1 glutamate mutase L [Anaerolineae bacterium]